MDSATWCRTPAAASAARRLRPDTLADDGVDAAIGRGGEDLVAALAQNRDGLRADQAGAADNDDLHGLRPCRCVQAVALPLNRVSVASAHYPGPTYAAS